DKRGLMIDDEKYAARALASCQEKVKTLVELAEMADFYFRENIEIQEEARKKGLDESGKQVLDQLKSTLASLEDFSHDSVAAALNHFAEKNSLKLGKVAQPLRSALTGSTISPGIFDVIAVLGKEKTLSRIDRALSS
ncbi:MAG TPA: glutamate--tRNA ligase, partial [bacterium]|nr:glutamate--tRNA ligase [bacterium]